MIKLLLANSLVCIFCNLSYSQNVKEKNKEEAFTPLEIEAAFPKGQDAWKRFLDSNFAKLNIESFYPNPKSDSSFRIVIDFIIDSTGNSIVKTTGEENKLLFIEIKRIFALAPKWSPKIVNGRKVPDYIKQPITITLPHNED
jgi:hypothetical protein